MFEPSIEEKLLVYEGKTYEGFSITTNGEIKNLKRNRFYKNSNHRSGYLMVYLPLGKRGSVKAIRVHKAVAETFLPNPQQLPIVHHKDGNKHNPKLSNLEWVTVKQNTHYAYAAAKKTTEFFNNRKLKESDVEKIKKSVAGGSSIKCEAKRYGVSCTTIINLLTGKTYAKHHYL